MPDGTSSELRVQPGTREGTPITVTGSTTPGKRRVDGTFIIEQEDCMEFERCRDNLTCTVPTGTTQLQTLDDRTLHFEADTAGRVIIPGEGMPILHGDGLKGNLIITIEGSIDGSDTISRDCDFSMSSDEVRCPICSESVPSANIHLHLVHCKRCHVG